MIKITNVKKLYGEVHALDGLDLVVAEGEFIAVMGASGSGKSTLLNLIGGMDRPDSGHIEAAGRDLGALNDEALTRYRRRTVGFVFQFFNLLPNLTALENVEMPLLLNGETNPERAAALIAETGLAGKEARLPHELSGGEQQRIAIARALVHDPAIILADEPTGSLDSRTGRDIMLLIQRLAREKNKTVVLVTHEDYIAHYAERIVTLKDGRVMVESDRGSSATA